jgi:branched-subunit amino acid ABC-type transport system permease component
MNLIENIAHIAGIVIGICILLLAYRIIPSKLDSNDHRLSRILKAIGFLVLISSIVRLIQIWL